MFPYKQTLDVYISTETKPIYVYFHTHYLYVYISTQTLVGQCFITLSVKKKATRIYHWHGICSFVLRDFTIQIVDYLKQTENDKPKQFGMGRHGSVTQVTISATQYSSIEHSTSCEKLTTYNIYSIMLTVTTLYALHKKCQYSKPTNKL